MNRIEQFFSVDEENAQRLSELEQQLNDQLRENGKMKKEVEKLKADLEERDRKIKELTIRLEARNKAKVGGKDMEQQFMSLLSGQDPIFKISDQSFTTTMMGDDRMSLFPGGTSQLQELEKAMEAKDEEINSLKTRVEVLEAEVQSKD